MLEAGRERAATTGYPGIRFVEANAEDLPFDDGAFDAYTIAFGIRNVPRIEQALAEAYRTLRFGGRFICLEFSDVDVPFLDRIYEGYSFNAIPVIGRIFANDAEARDTLNVILEFCTFWGWIVEPEPPLVLGAPQVFANQGGVGDAAGPSGAGPSEAAAADHA